jgi:predicted TIM-barrel fold metal-dependent hydrolase
MAAVTAPTPAVDTGGASVPVQLIDCDTHVIMRSPDEMADYLDEPWRSRLFDPLAQRQARDPGASTSAADGGSYDAKQTAGRYGHAAPFEHAAFGEHAAKGVKAGYLPFGNGSRAGYFPYGDGQRLDAYPTTGGPAGSDPDTARQHLFVEMGVDYPLLLPTVFEYGVDPELNAAFCAATNRWMADTWLSRHNAEGRFLGAIFVSFDDPARAAREIETWAGHPGFRQVLIHHLSDRPLGHPIYDPIWEAASRHRLPVAMHFGSMGGAQSGVTPVGPFPHYVDYHSVSTPLAYSAHIVSWICNGTFDRFPDLRFVMVEGGFLWHRPIIARLSRHWARTSAELPAKAKDPYQYILDHVRFCTQPIEESPQPGDAGSMFELAGADRVLVFSSDYPHYDYDDPVRALPPHVSEATRRRVMYENARELYDLPTHRPRDRFDDARDAR